MSESDMNDCMLSEERLDKLAEIVCNMTNGTRCKTEVKMILSRFFAVPPGSVRVEVAVCVSGKEVAASVVGQGNIRAMATAHSEIWGDPTHECYATLYVPPVPPTPVVEVVQ